MERWEWTLREIDAMRGEVAALKAQDERTYILQRRVTNWLTPSTHFDRLVMPAGWAWAGAPFVTPAGVALYESLLTLHFGAAQATPKAFLYASTDLPLTKARVALGAPLDNAYVGARLDDGTDNNYVEAVLIKLAGSPLLAFRGRVRSGGGAVATTDHLPAAILPAMFVALGYTSGGARWGNWAYTVDFGVDSRQMQGFGYASGLTWLPTRRGLVFYHPGATPAIYQTAICDWLATVPVPVVDLITNGDFELPGAPPDPFADWWYMYITGNVEDETVAVHAGGHACKLTTGPAASTDAWVGETPTVTPLQTYTLSFWARGDGTNAGFYEVYDATHFASIIPVTSTGVIGTTYTQVSVPVTIPAGCTHVNVDFGSPTAGAGVAYVDDVSFV